MAKVLNPKKYVLGQNASLRVSCATDDEMSMMGLQGLGLFMGFTQQSQEIPMIGQRVAPKVYTGASYDETTVNANFIPGDGTQEYLRNTALSGNIIKNVRAYLKDGCNFSAPDQVADNGGGLTSGTSGLNVGSVTDPQIGSPTDVWTNSVSFAPAGPFSLFVAHTPANAGGNLATSVNGSDVDITLKDGTNWDSYGFETGDTVIIDWDGSTTEAPKYSKVKSISSDVMTLDGSVGDTDAIAISDPLPAKCRVHGATPSVVSGIEVEC
jgi:hypothetical protein